MKIKIPFDFDRMAQKEIGVELNIPEGVVRELVRGFFMNLDYSERQAWIHSKIPDKNVKHIDDTDL